LIGIFTNFVEKQFGEDGVKDTARR
jgi:hypothetical protein